MSVAKMLIDSHLIGGKLKPGEEIALRIDQTLTQDATGTLVMLELEAMELDRVRTECSAQYVDHNLLQEDYKNADDHRFLFSACQKFGVWYSKAGNGVSHVVHQERFGIPGKSLLGSDSHTPAAGSLGMLAFGAGGIEVALAMAGEPFFVKMPLIWGIEVKGKLRPWVSAKDVILEMLRRHGVSGGVGRIMEYYGPGLEFLDVMDRHVIANMGTELGATTSVFPSDHKVKEFLTRNNRPTDFVAYQSGDQKYFDLHETLDLSEIEPLIALPSSPGNVVPVREVQGLKIYQAYLGSSANPGFRDFAISAEMLRSSPIAPEVSFDVNPASNRILQQLVESGHWRALLAAGSRAHQTGCNGCIGMGQAPATKSISLRTVPRNFPGRSGTPEDKVYLVSPETATASAIRGVITDPRDLNLVYPSISLSNAEVGKDPLLIAPLPAAQALGMRLSKGPNIVSIPHFGPLPDFLEVPVLLKLKNDVSTDEILPAGASVLPLRSNIPKISEFTFRFVDRSYVERTEPQRAAGHAIVAGANYGQGSSREHAALAPRYLGLRLVLAISYGRIHWQNLINFGVLPLVFEKPGDLDRISQGDMLEVEEVSKQLQNKSSKISVRLKDRDETMTFIHTLSERQLEIILKGGLINTMKDKIGLVAQKQN